MVATLRTLVVMFLLPPAALFLFFLGRYAEWVILVEWALVLGAGITAIQTSGWSVPIRTAAGIAYAVAFAAILPFIAFLGGCASGCSF
jgi:hypothetical protein